MDESGDSGRPHTGADDTRPDATRPPGPDATHASDPTGTRVPGPDTTGTPGPDGSRAPGPDGSHVFGPDGSRASGPDGSRAPGSEATRVSGSGGTRTPGSDGSRVPGPDATGTPGPRVPGPDTTGTPGPDGPRASGPSGTHTPGLDDTRAPDATGTPDPDGPRAPGPDDSRTPDPAPTPGGPTSTDAAPAPSASAERSSNPGGGLLMGRPFGVPVYVAPSWFLVAALITWVFGGQLDIVLPELGAARYLVSLFFAVAFYASVLVHELAHTVAALRFKLPVRRIQLQFFGGVSEIEKETETPGREFVLAFVGPLLSLALAGLFYWAMDLVEAGTVPGVLLAGLMISNLIVAAFNLLPGLPLDGGRMLRAVVWKITGNPMTGTVAAAWVGRALAVAVLIGLPLLTHTGALGNKTQDITGMDTVLDALLAAILAAIIWTGAGNSLRMARLRQHLPDLRARTLTRRAVPVEPATPLSEALRRANEAGARALVVVDGHGTPTAVVRETAIGNVPEHRRPWVAVSGLAADLTDDMRIPAELAGEALLDRLRAAPATEYLVIEETGEIYGVLSTADVERAFVKAMARPRP
ncbi:site-2 protease family protein [Streptomyces sp. NPDC088745]|uniref:site-2 protease family protein n=1 Tax=Streptomyces sp. NPDC088745 TaxID=3365884 RepID=UPI0037FB1A42